MNNVIIVGTEDKPNFPPESFKFSHLRRLQVLAGDSAPTISPRGGATVAFVEDRDVDGNVITVAAVAFCHDNDNYNRRLGRAKAAGQLLRLTSKGGTLTERNVNGLDRYYRLAGGTDVVVPQLLRQLEKAGGYARR